MARILLSILPASGHVNPMIAIAQALRREGHEIKIATDQSYESQLSRAGFDLLPLPYPPGALERGLEYLRRPANWLAQFKRHAPPTYFFLHLADLTADLIQHIERFEPDVMLTDLNLYAGPVAAEVCNLPYASYCAIVNTLLTPDAPPYGLGLDWHPEGDWRRRWWPVLGLGMHAVLWRYDRVVNRVRRSYGLPAVRQAMLTHSPYLALVPTTEAYEYPRRCIPPQMMYVGPVTAAERGEVHDDFPWEWLEEDQRPTVYVSMGTIVEGKRIFREMIEAARGANWKAILAIGRNDDARAYADAPDNVLVRNFVPQLALLPKVDAVVSHGGNNTVTETLLHGLPLVVIPNSADQPESAGRVKASGAGIRLRPRQAKARALRNAIDRLLDARHFREAAQRIQASYQACDGPLTCARLITRFAEAKKPLYRPGGMGPTLCPEDVARLEIGELGAGPKQ